MKKISAFACDSCDYIDIYENDMKQHEEYHAREKEKRIKRDSSGQLTIREIIGKAKNLPDLPVVISCLDIPFYNGQYPSDTNSYRGYYDELAIALSKDRATTLVMFIRNMKNSIGHSYSGYKGGDYVMNEDTFVWIANYGYSSQLAVTDLHLSPGGETIQLVATKLEF